MKQLLTADNYFSDEANRQYWSASQVKTFDKCEARAMAEISGIWKPEPSTALMVGSYVDEALTGDLDRWKIQHPEILKRDGSLKAEYAAADQMVARALQSDLFMDYLDGQHQVIVTGKLFGEYPFKAKLDAYHPGKAIVDLKTVKNLDGVYLPGSGRVDFATAWDWPLQMAIYQAITEQQTGVKLPCYLAVITKENPPDIELVQIEQERMDAELAWLERSMPRFDAVKKGIIEPERCGHCPWCRLSHHLDGVKMLGDFGLFEEAEE